MDAYSQPTAPPAHHEKTAGNSIEAEDLHRIVHVGVVERHAGGQDRVRPGGEAGLTRARSVRSCPLIDETCTVRSGPSPGAPLNQVDAVPGDVSLDRPSFSEVTTSASRVLEAFEGDRRVELETEPVHLAVAKAAQVEHGLTQGLGGNARGAHGDATGCRRLLHDRDGLSVIGGLGRAPSLRPGRIRSPRDRSRSSLPPYPRGARGPRASTACAVSGTASRYRRAQRRRAADPAPAPRRDRHVIRGSSTHGSAARARAPLRHLLGREGGNGPWRDAFRAGVGRDQRGPRA